MKAERIYRGRDCIDYVIGIEASFVLAFDWAIRGRWHCLGETEAHTLEEWLVCKQFHLDGQNIWRAKTDDGLYQPVNADSELKLMCDFGPERTESPTGAEQSDA